MPEGTSLIATGLPETFLVHLKIALWAGVIVSSPFWLWQLWAFVAPGLYQREKKAAARLTAGAVGLLLAGAAFAYWAVLPIGFKFFMSFGGDNITILPVIHEYLSLVMTLLLSFGLAFELPLCLMFLASAGVVDSKRLSRFRPYAVVIIVTLSAFLTPPDVVSQILMSIPMLGLYELSLFLIRRKERHSLDSADDEEDEGDEGGDAAGGGQKARGQPSGGAKGAAGSPKGKKTDEKRAARAAKEAAKKAKEDRARDRERRKKELRERSLAEKALKNKEKEKAAQ
jgi:sec-independent protein translocase protein TatC